jgi:hypothetical protein
MRTAIAILGLALTQLPGVPAAAAQQAPHGSLAAALSVAQRLVALSDTGALNSAEGKALFTGELADFDAPSLGPVGRPDEAVALADGDAVVRLPATEQFKWDLYLFLAPSGQGWRARAIRVLAIPRFAVELRDQLHAGEKLDDEQAATLRNLDLVLSSDSELRAWFARHRDELEALRAEPNPEAPGAVAAVKRLDASRFTETPEGLPALVIGGILDNTDGFLFVPPGKSPPPITSSEYIWIEPLGGGWYLYRTT